MERDRKIEASMPVQSRIDLRTLAELLVYWEKQGIYINSMSRLVSWSLDALRMILDKNGVIQYKIDRLEMAYDVLEGKNMLQKSMKKKMQSKYIKSRAMENLRFEGWNEREAGGEFYKELHPKNEVEPFSKSTRVSDREFEKVTGMSREKARRALTAPQVSKEDIKKQMERFKFDEHGVYIKEQQEKKVKEEDKISKRGEGKYGRTRPQGGGIIIDVDEQVRRMEEEDKKIADNEMMPPGYDGK